MNIGLIAVNNCMVSGIYGVLDIFYTANFCIEKKYGKNSKHHFNCNIYTIDDRPVKGFNGIEIKPTASIKTNDALDILIISASAEIVVECCQESTEIEHQGAIINWLTYYHQLGTVVASYCTGAFLLATSGLLTGKLATTHWRNADMFRRLYPNIKLTSDELIVDNGDTICSGGSISYIDLSLYLINKYIGKDISAECAKLLVFDPIREKQSPYVSFEKQKDHHDQAILKAQEYIESHYQQDISIEALAERVGLGSRTFKRRFKQATSENPLTYLQRIRVEQAKLKLENSTESINKIIWSVGYEDISSFRQLFKRFTGLTPKDYRQKFAV
ncbi:GlxA family transcriptional regulator [Thalassotalea hakodatensis]|uniref:GlxA family transcriptional regulator n=1 Tax=Thalassotalea hakodatensis TaxID=3030492 RepID=UPI002572B161|nr:helix-turn-helix domain-containing protein [Thalassotalea hakodatensis]